MTELEVSRSEGQVSWNSLENVNEDVKEDMGIIGVKAEEAGDEWVRLYWCFYVLDCDVTTALT